MKKLRFVDLFAGLGGFHRALEDLGHECVFACEIDPELQALYLRNFPKMRGRVFGDIRLAKQKVPSHDVLCAGFPCQPFSKSGAQLGTQDETRGTLFHEILEILEKRKPEYIILENVGNFGRHDDGRTWRVVRRRLEALGYDVAGTEHITPLAQSDWRDVGLRATRSRQGGIKKRRIPGISGPGLLSPHHFGQPHHRERFFIIGSRSGLPGLPLPSRRADLETSLATIVQSSKELTARDRLETALSDRQIECIEVWNELLESLPKEFELPPCPIWGDEFFIQYPYVPRAPFAVSTSELRTSLRRSRAVPRERLFELLPSYAREQVHSFRQWKINYIASNRSWWSEARKCAPKGWLSRMKKLPPSLRKLEWNVKGGERDLWCHVLQFRPSGLRAKRYTSSPALVAMTSTQIPILGPKRRFITRIEGLRLQGLPDDHELPVSRTLAFKALGNGVHTVVVKAIAMQLLGTSSNIQPLHEGLHIASKDINISRGHNARRAA